MLTTDHSHLTVINWPHLTPDCYLRPLGVQKVGPIFPAGLCNDNDVVTVVGGADRLGPVLLGIK